MVRLGVNIHPKIRGGEEYSAQEKTDRIAFLDELNPSGIVVMDDFNFAIWCKNRYPNCEVIHRVSHKMDGKFWSLLSPLEYYNGMKYYQKYDIRMYIMNEPSTYTDNATMQAKVRWLTEVMTLYGKDHYPTVIDNVGTGHYDFTWFIDPVRWNIIKPLFDAFQAYDTNHWGLHEYFSYRGLENGNGRVGRHAQMAAYLQLHKQSNGLPYKMPSVHLTEVGCDHIDNTNHRGYVSSMTDPTYGATLVQAQQTAWNVPYIKSASIYCYGSVAGEADKYEWYDYDISRPIAERTRSMLIASNQNEIDAIGDDTQPIPPVNPVDPRVAAILRDLQLLIDKYK